MDKEQLEKLEKEELVNKLLKCCQNRSREWLNLLSILLIFLASITFSIWLLPVSFDDLSTAESINRLNKATLQYYAFIIGLRATVFIFTLYIIRKIVSPDE